MLKAKWRKIQSTNEIGLEPLERLRGCYGNTEGLGFLAFRIPLTISCITVFLGCNWWACSSDHMNGQAEIKEAGVVWPHKYEKGKRGQKKQDE